MAAAMGHERVVDTLVQASNMLNIVLDVNKANNQGRSPLHEAAALVNENDASNIMDILLGHHGIILGQIDKRGRTVLHVASAEGSQKIVEKILAAQETVPII